jgi:hypothetical protein
MHLICPALFLFSSSPSRLALLVRGVRQRIFNAPSKPPGSIRLVSRPGPRTGGGGLRARRGLLICLVSTALGVDICLRRLAADIMDAAAFFRS